MLSISWMQNWKLKKKEKKKISLLRLTANALLKAGALSMLRTLYPHHHSNAVMPQKQ